MNKLFLFIIITIIFILIISIISYLVGGYSWSPNKEIPFESGIISIDSIKKINYFAKFYILAILFVIFDLEAIYLFSWAIAIREIGWTGFIGIVIFIFILLIGLIYDICNDLFD
ncbi:NADH-quinone oxidoreductase chain A [Candidatus Portiera aleyrodidarum]|uniref:NADH-quinone oxidoreductase subunit n=1 Tax=Candidatus Portiera aleyrodidarum TV TaxID=1297582 RepID=A0A8D3X7R8_9GAMM|nr:NADH-quinone oxidoreductase subunit A [Candidatus Portiera aleyrodidarum]AGI27247.1 NADH:ubiquinone oxidoreductase subunit 3 (chain A) [Candidatus Portiera aleyrodidarum TV]CEI59240.1 NADH-quinone oxidoreductase chain A [Candidatus Portiera aleyrodidarum]